MPSLFEIDSISIELLTDVQLTSLLNRLLHLEAIAAGIAGQSIDVALNINVPDGGEDGRIEWKKGPDSTDYLPARLVQFQCKATPMGPTACSKEICDKDGRVKPMVDEVLSEGGVYIIFNNKSVNKQAKKRRIKKIREILIELERPYADTAAIEIYDTGVIQGWVNKFLAAVATISYWVQRPLVEGMQAWEEWASSDEYNRFAFVPDMEREKAIKQIKDELAYPRKFARIIGLSGLGKTRLALEAFRPQRDKDALHHELVYLDVSYGASNLAGKVSDWVRGGFNGIIVVDNCELGLHKRLKAEISRPESKLSLLTLDYNLEKDPETPTIKLSPLDDIYIKQILEPAYGEAIPDLNRIVSFAQGFPQMAVLLAYSRLNESPDMGSLTDDDLLKKLLWGTGPPNINAQLVIAGCALFEKFGLFEEAIEEYEFIAGDIVNISTDDFYRHVMHFKNRGIIDTRGRYAQVIPKPLAIRLSSDWWRHVRPGKVAEILKKPMPGQLDESFCERVAKLDFLPEVKNLTKELCGEQGPFGQAEVILSERGSDLFRFFVDVNPEAIADALKRVFDGMDKADLFKIDGNVRRNLVWSLEKLCFRKNTFDLAARLLFRLALAENESWSNNATGQFLQLFKIYLSGTEAPPNKRLEIVDEALSSEEPDAWLLAIDALGQALETTHFSRTGGAEEQGLGKPLEDWHPKTWGEAFEYWESALERLVALVELGKGVAGPVMHAIAPNIRGLMQYGRVDAIDNALHRIVEHRGRFWPEALNSIQDSLHYDSDKMPIKGQQKLKDWIGLLKPDALRDRLKLMVSIPPYKHEKEKNGHYVDLAAEKAKQLAQECADNISELIDNLEILLIGEQRQGYVFGKRLAEIIIDSTLIIEKGLAILSRKPSKEGNPILLSGMLEHLKSRNPENWEEVIDCISKTDGLIDYYVDLIRLSSPELVHLKILFDFIKSGRLSVSVCRAFSYGSVTDHLKPDEMAEFGLLLNKVYPEGPWVALDILRMYCHGNNERWYALRPTFKKFISKIDFSDKENRTQMDMPHWEKSVKFILAEHDETFAEEITGKILHGLREGLSYGDIEHYVKPVTQILFKDYTYKVWPIFSDAIEHYGSIGHIALKNLLSARRSPEQLPSTILEIPQDYLLNWCNENPNFAPQFLAQVIPIIIERKGVWTIHPLAVALLDDFGNDENVLASISRNMGSFAWWGSLVPFYKRQEEALSLLENHDNSTLRRWVSNNLSYIRKRIEEEARRTEERDWGIL